MNFSIQQIIFFSLAILFYGLGILSFNKKKRSLAVFLLFTATIFIGIFASILDPFLNLWNEQFHALVAKNMAKDSFIRPFLYADYPLLNGGESVWTDSQIYLHKQPFALWAMALSIKMFGLNVWAIRIPSIIFHAFSAVLIYRIGKYVYNERTGFIAALFFGVSFYQLELIAGKQSFDHIDVTFIFFVLASFWAWMEYNNRKSYLWVVLIGVFSGLAVLTNWLPGLLVFLCWFFALFANVKSILDKGKLYDLLLAFVIAVVIALPWQLYLISEFKAEAFAEYSLFFNSFTNVIHGEGGGFFYHFTQIKYIYAPTLAFIIFMVLSTIYGLGKTNFTSQRMFLFAAVFIIYLCYGFSKTKNTGDTAIISPIMFLFIASIIELLLDQLNRGLRNRKKIAAVITSVLVLSFCYLFFNFFGIQQNHTDKSELVASQRFNYAIEQEHYKNMVEVLPSNAVIFTNDNTFNNIRIMYFTPFISYNHYPSDAELDLLISKSYVPYIYNKGDIPWYLRDNYKVKIITY